MTLALHPGLRLGELTLLDRAPPRGALALWYCRCSCGNTPTVYACHLRAGNSRSCGCLRVKPRTAPFPAECPAGAAWIALTNDRFALVDAVDLPSLLTHKWCHEQRTGYASNSRRGRLHNVLLPPRAGFMVDHINGDKLDCRRSNLRYATAAQNAHNARGHGGRSGFKGVDRYEPYDCWRARIRKDGRVYFLGYFDTPEEAARAYDARARTLHGAFARPNYPAL